MARAYQPKRHSLAQMSSVGMAHLLAAREDICNVVKTSSGSSRENTACAVNKVLWNETQSSLCAQMSECCL